MATVVTPGSWDKSTDTGYTWYSDSTLRILPTGRTLAYNEETAYFPVTAHGLTGLEVRARGELSFDCLLDELIDQSYNSHALYCYTTSNTSGQQLRAEVKIVGYSGTSAYSATTVLIKNPEDVQPRIYLSPESVVVSSAATSATVNVIAENCLYDYFRVTGTGGNWVSAPEPIASGTQITFTFPANNGPGRTATYSMYLFSVTGNYRFNAFLMLGQQEAASQGPEEPGGITGSTDTGYTWYKDTSILNILPTARTLTATEITAYYPITAHTLENLELRSSGDVSFTYTINELQDQSYNSHALYCYTEDNTSAERQESELVIVGYKGTSGYSASTYLFKNSPTDAWITASPNPVEAPSVQNSINVYLTLTSCERSVEDELTGNTQLASWVTVSRVNNTAITFNFAANSGNEDRSTYYMVYGRDSQNLLVRRRIDLYQGHASKAVTITPSRASLSKEAGSFTCTINSTENGTFTFSAASWMRITSYSATSSHGGILYVDYYENQNNWARTGDVKVFQQINTSPYTLSAQTTVSQAISGSTAYLNVSPTAATLTRFSGYTEFVASYSGLASAPQLIEGEGNMNLISYSFDGQYITVVYGENTASTDKTKSLYLTASTLQGEVIQREIRLRQTGTGVPVAPVWRDYVLDIHAPGMAYVNYTVSFNGETVYTGRAYARPDATGIVVYFNQLVKTYLNNKIVFDEGYQTIEDWLGNFTITSPELGDIASVAFYEDYSYENREMQNVMCLNNPITGEVPEGGFVPFSFFITGDTGTFTVYTNNQ